ncbi:LPO_1073/Vpar_1526 family protein [Lysinibacillus sp. LZ02]|uniref:LPO_1073/Vpar_1526 family protein n=1 Tax=Lysinibacillus sp. LZ02 TaxID=3420668 RepID=UPI003D3698AD
MIKNNQTQKIGDNSTSLQVGGDMYVTHGISYFEAKEIALDVFKTNFYQLSEDAASVAKQRAEEITDKFLNELNERLPNSINQMNNPDMQYALFTAQREYARTGDNDLLEILVNILVDRASIDNRSLLQIVLNESLDVVTKLTNEQLDILSLVFLLRYTRRLHFKNIDDFKSYLLNVIIPFMDVPKENSYYQHLEYTGCGSISVLDNKIEETFRQNYQGIFSKGFSREECENLVNGEVLSSTILIPCFHNKELVQVKSLNDEQLEEICLEAGASEELIQKMKDLQNSRIMNEGEIKDFVTSLDPKIKQLFDLWYDSSLNRMTLTSVGIAIAHANLQRKINDKYDLSIWI